MPTDVYLEVYVLFKGASEGKEFVSRCDTKISGKNGDFS